MAETRLFTIGTETSCADGTCGTVKRVVVDPVARTVTHLVVKPRLVNVTDRLVPLDLVVEGTPDTIRLRCTIAEFERLDPAVETEFMPNTVEYPGYASDQVYTRPFYSLSGTMLTQRVPKTATRDTVPLGEVDVRRGDHVHATDGDIGKIQGLVIDAANRHVTHVLLQEGHVWGRKEVAIPISAVTDVSGCIRLNLTRQQVGDLPPVDIEHPPDRVTRRPVSRLTGPPRQVGAGRLPTATSKAACASSRVESSVGIGESPGATSIGISVHTSAAAFASPACQAADDGDVLLTVVVGEHRVHQLVEDDPVEHATVFPVGQLGRYPARAEGARVDRAVHGVAGAEHGDPGAAVAGGLVGDDLGDVQARQGEILAGLFQGQVGGVVRADEEVGACVGEPPHARRQRVPDRQVVSLVPRGHAARQGDAVESDVRMLVGPHPVRSLQAEAAQAQRRALHAVRQDAKVFHNGMMAARWPGSEPGAGRCR